MFVYTYQSASGGHDVESHSGALVTRVNWSLGLSLYILSLQIDQMC